ncbi:MAG TPA: HAMP domain-containing sensor histidine kinase [Pedobacter sp.]|nr:HAMP domain-containing sensor histidine kinase [Pedobacter sp.]
MVKIVHQEGLPFANNIHFAYDIRLGHFQFIHSSLEWITSAGSGTNARDVIEKIEPEDIIYLKGIFSNVIAGDFNGRINIKLRASERVRWLQVVPFLADQQGTRLVLGAVMEVTDEVNDIQTITKYANKKNSILYMLGHDLRGPLNMAKSLTKTITRQIGDQEFLKKTGYISSILQQCINLISDLVNREFLETTSVELVKKRVDIVSKIKEYLDECNRSESLAQISFHLKSSSDQIFIMLDDAKFMQIVNNLISNSLKFTPAKGAIHIYIEEEANQVNFKFSDTGIGIPNALLPEIFEKFTSARRPGLQGEPTLGLGLSIVKTIVGWHDGSVSCESTEGDGTTIFITLPKNIPA